MRNRFALTAVVAVATLGLSGAIVSWCVVGQGRGELHGTVSAPDCGVPPQPLAVTLRFFGAVAEKNSDTMTIRAQADSEDSFRGDGIDISIRDAAMFQTSMLNTPIELQPGPTDENAPVHVTLRLLKRCRSEEEIEPSIAFRAIGGTITFEALHVPWGQESDRAIAATLTDVLFVDDADHSERYAKLSGFVEFDYREGRSLQPFPRTP